MDKLEQIRMNVRTTYNKMVWLNNLNIKNRFKDYTSSEVHCIEFIGRNADANVTKLADNFYMTRGAISKMTKKLMDKGILTSFQKPENKKEVYFQLTEQGKTVFAIHEDMHQEFQERDKAIFDSITAEQCEQLLDFINNYNQHLDQEIEKIDVH